MNFTVSNDLGECDRAAGHICRHVCTPAPVAPQRQDKPPGRGPQCRSLGHEWGGAHLSQGAIQPLKLHKEASHQVAP